MNFLKVHAFAKCQWHNAKNQHWKPIPNRRVSAAEIDELRNCGKNGRGASGGKIFNGRTENGNDCGRNGLNQSQRLDNWDINRNRVHLAVREHRDGALMVFFAGIRVEPFVQRGGGRHRVQQEDKPGQQRGDGRLAARLKMALYETHNTFKLADIMPGASGFQMADTNAAWLISRRPISHGHSQVWLKFAAGWPK